MGPTRHPSPVDLKRVRKEDEDYWDTWRSAPKAFIPLEVTPVAEPLWVLSSLRWTATGDQWPRMSDVNVTDGAHGASRPSGRHSRLRDGTNPDFGGTSSTSSFFLVVAGFPPVLCAHRRRARELGLLLAVGFRHADLRRTLLTEAGRPRCGGSYRDCRCHWFRAAIMYGLRTWWSRRRNDCLPLHVDPLTRSPAWPARRSPRSRLSLVSLRRIRKRSARTLLTAGLTPLASGGRARVHSRNMPRYIALRAFALAIILIVAALAGASDAWRRSLARRPLDDRAARRVAAANGHSDARRVVSLRRLCALAPDAQRAVRVTHRIRLLRHRLCWRVSARPERHIAREGFGNGRLRADGGVGGAAHV